MTRQMGLWGGRMNSLMPIVQTPNDDTDDGAAMNGGHRPTVVAAPDSISPELSASPRRRTFTAKDKLRVVGWRVADAESVTLFQPLFEDAIAKHNVQRGQLTLHADRGAPLQAKATAFLLADLGVTRTHNRPHTSNDNPFSESHFKRESMSTQFHGNCGKNANGPGFTGQAHLIPQNNGNPTGRSTKLRRNAVFRSQLPMGMNGTSRQTCSCNERQIRIDSAGSSVPSQAARSSSILGLSGQPGAPFAPIPRKNA